MKNFNKALNYSFLLLKYRARSKYEIISRLKKKGYDSVLIQKVLNYLQENRYIDDKNFTHLFIFSSLEKGWGPQRIYFNLKKFGIPQELCDLVLEYRHVYNIKIKEAIAGKLKYYSAQGISKKKSVGKIIRFLTSKGFDKEDIFREIGESSEVDNVEYK